MNTHTTLEKESPWTPLIEQNVKTAGIYVRSLHQDKEANRSATFLLKFNPGSSYPNHNHPSGEEVYVLEGEVRFGSRQLHAGDYLYTAPGDTHAVFSKTGCILLFIVPEEVVIL
jgi:quercetin dioxygenase-like cupin family protein